MPSRHVSWRFLAYVTPEVEQALKNERRIHRSNITMIIMVAVTCVIVAVGAIVLFTKIDAKVSNVQTVATTIRSNQISNTKISDNRANCQDQDFNAAFQALQLAFAGDKNAADYPKVKKC